MNSTDHFETIVSEHYEALFRFALSLTRSESDACDLTQQTFYVWATKGHQLRDVSKVKTWLFTTLHRAFIQLRRRQGRYTHEPLEEIPEQLTAVPPTRLDLIDASQVRSALAQLEEVHQAAVALFYLDDCSYKEIAATLEVPIGTVKSRIARGVAQLRKIFLSDDCGGLVFDRGDGERDLRRTVTDLRKWPTVSLLYVHHLGWRNFIQHYCNKPSNW